MQSVSPNGDQFAFLDHYNIALRQTLGDAETLLNTLSRSPHHSAVASRRFIEFLSNEIAVRNGLPRCGEVMVGDKKEDLNGFIKRLDNKGLLSGRRWQFDFVRVLGNDIHANSDPVSIRNARKSLDICKELAHWFDESSPKRREKRAETEVKSTQHTVQTPVSDNVHTFPKSAPISESRPISEPSPTANETTSARVFMLITAVALVFGLGWFLFAMSNRQQSTPRPPPPVQAAAPIQYFDRPQTYTVAPEDGVSPVNVRSSPNSETNDNWTGELTPGTEVTGIASTRDAQGEFWILLENNRGYVSAPLLRPLPPPLVQPIQTLPPNDADSGDQGDTSNGSANVPPVTSQEANPPEQDVQSQPRQ